MLIDEGLRTSLHFPITVRAPRKWNLQPQKIRESISFQARNRTSIILENLPDVPTRQRKFIVSANLILTETDNLQSCRRCGHLQDGETLQLCVRLPANDDELMHARTQIKNLGNHLVGI